MENKPIINHNINIKDGEKGIFQTVDYMWNYALRDANTPLAEATVKDLRGTSKIETLKNIFDWVVANVKYELDPPDYEMITSPIHYLNGNRSTGDCDCMTTLLVCLLETAGFDCAITIIQWRINEYTHVFAEVWYDNDWFVLDPTLGNKGFGKQDKKIKKFKRITKKDMAKLVVLADGNNENNNDNENNGNAPKIKRIPHYDYRKCRVNSCGCRPDSSNHNNININFGTNTESSYSNAYNSNSSNSNSSNNEPKPISLPTQNIDISKIIGNRGNGSNGNNNSNSNNSKQKERPIALCPVIKDGKITWERCDTININNIEELRNALENIQEKINENKIPSENKIPNENNIPKNNTKPNVSKTNNTNNVPNDVTNTNNRNVPNDVTNTNTNNRNNTNNTNNANNILEQINESSPDTSLVVPAGTKPKYVPQAKERKPSYVEFP